jgi:hypothetical protein
MRRILPRPAREQGRKLLNPFPQPKIIENHFSFFAKKRLTCRVFWCYVADKDGRIQLNGNGKTLNVKISMARAMAAVAVAAAVPGADLRAQEAAAVATVSSLTEAAPQSCAADKMRPHLVTTSDNATARKALDCLLAGNAGSNETANPPQTMREKPEY